MATSFLSPCKSMPAGAPGGALVFAYCFGCGVPSGGKEVGLFRQSKACKDVVEQVYFLGAEAAVQFQPSSTWLAEQAAAWPWKSHLLINAPRSEALSVLGSEGVLVVFCSLVENLPYVVAEVGCGARSRYTREVVYNTENMKRLNHGVAQQSAW